MSPVQTIVFRAALVFALVAGVALRVWTLKTSLATLESDEAISGLMALRMLDGEFAALYWLSPYGGTLESVVAAAVFAVVGSSVLALKLTTLGVFVAAAALTWRIGIRTVGRAAALVGTALFWIFPAYLVWWTTKARGYYGMGVLLALVVLLLALRLRDRSSRLDAAALGLALGLGWWTTPGVVLIAAPALAWLLVRRPSVVRLLPFALPGAIVGAVPWIAWNARNDWLSLDTTPVAAESSSFGSRLGHLFTDVVPTWLGLRVPFSLEWLVWPPLGWALTIAALAALVAALVRRSDALEPLLVVCVAFPFLYAFSAFTYYYAEPRYVVYVSPVLALLLGRAFASPPLAALAVVVAATVSAVGLVRMEKDGLFQPGLAEGRAAGDLGPAIELLEREGERYALADYWIAYRLTFESAERIVATSTDFVRYEPHDRLVRASGHPARVFAARSTVEPRRRRELVRDGYRRHRVGDWVVYVHGP